MLKHAYVPPGLRDPKAFATFSKELLNASTCCDAVEQSPWSLHMAQGVLNKAYNRKKGRQASVRAVSQPSEPSCDQPFMVFKAQEEDGHVTYIIAFRSDLEHYDTADSAPVPFVAVNDTFKVHKSLLARAVKVPLQPLPLVWRGGLEEQRHRLLLTGFSVGGAVAALATLQLLEAEPDLKDQICCYTFGAPLQGDQKYADYINLKYASNFYHTMINGDQMPGVLTLVGKVVRNDPARCSNVVNICKQALATTAQVVTSVAASTVAPGIGPAIVQSIDFYKLGHEITSLVKTERKSKMPLPDYKFGGSLVYLDTKQPGKQPSMFFVDGRITSNAYFQVLEKSVTSLPSQPNVPEFILLHKINEFSRAIKDLDDSDSHNHSHNLGREVMIDQGTVRNVAECSTVLDAMHLSPAARDVTPGLEDFLVPRFDEKPMQVWLDKQKNIYIQVYGKNMVFGLYVSYMLNNEEMVRVPVSTEYNPPSDDSKDGPDGLEEEPFLNLPLQFHTQYIGTKKLTFDDPDGIFKVQLAFGHTEVRALAADVSFFDSLNTLKVAERFATERPEELINLLLFWGMAKAQGLCTTAFHEIMNNPKDADKITERTLTALHVVPKELVLLDRFLFLIVIDQPSLRSAILNMDLPQPMMSALDLGLSLGQEEPRPKILNHCFSPDNASKDFTFSARYICVIESTSSKMNLSVKESAELLSKDLDSAFDGPKKMLVSYINQPFVFNEYAKEYSVKHMTNWEKEKATVAKAGTVVGFGASALPASILCINDNHWNNDWIKAFAVVVGTPPFLTGGMLFGAAWWLYHVLSSPIRMLHGRPGLMAEFRSKRGTAGYTWDAKLQAAVLLVRRKIEPPSLACKQEFDLYDYLKTHKVDILNGNRGFDTDNIEKLSDKLRHATAVAAQLANYALAGAWMYEIRRYLTERTTALGLIGSTKAGKSAFASQAFAVESNFGTKQDNRTRVLRHWTVTLQDRQFTLIDFPGSTDRAAQDWYIRGQLLAGVLVVVMNISEINTPHCLTLVQKACKARQTDEEICILFCFTHSDVEYDKVLDDLSANDNGSDIRAAQIFKQTFEDSKAELRVHALVGDSEGVQHLDYILSNMHACCFRRTLQGGTHMFKEGGVKNVKWVKDWCVDKLSTLHASRLKRLSSSPSFIKSHLPSLERARTASPLRTSSVSLRRELAAVDPPDSST